MPSIHPPTITMTSKIADVTAIPAIFLLIRMNNHQIEDAIVSQKALDSPAALVWTSLPDAKKR
jgi:hypothetical protein